jgi:hypothetical protein
VGLVHAFSADNQPHGAHDYEDNEHDGEHQRRRNRASILGLVVMHTLP